LHLEALPSTRREILVALKRRGPSTSAELAAELGVTNEAVRQQLKRLESDGAIVLCERDRTSDNGGRPAHRYRLTTAGEHLFPKHYDDLTVALLDTVGAQLGPEAVRAVLAGVVQAKVAAWRPRLEGLAPREKLEALRALYAHDDPWVEIVDEPDGWTLIERNCPFLRVAQERPALCSVTVQTLTRLMGRRVTRERSFQAGDGMCAFRIRSEPADLEAPFELEAEP